jgi:hypothetical protein
MACIRNNSKEFTNIMSKKLILAGAVAATAVAFAASTPVLATNGTVPGNPHTVSGGKVGICHATGSATNPYVFIIVDKHAAEAHAKHQDGRDVIGVTSADKCPKATTGSTAKGGQVLATSTTPVLAQAAPTTLPDTGAGLSALLGLPTLAIAGRAYLRSRSS